MVEKEIESLHSDHSVTHGPERLFKKLPPVLTFEVSRFKFNTQLVYLKRYTRTWSFQKSFICTDIFTKT
ncbi:hypothetical protein FQN60_010523 [Etheostoma spectabile]|uniref:Uncharacterized protein n=1 Tax=Etheostoma spectabile TaxID=54343 RepID=A0A5J5D3A2_9PERO|nr:hypothetical protein FQN60_010523 [Etheostoma spectabile]